LTLVGLELRRITGNAGYWLFVVPIVALSLISITPLNDPDVLRTASVVLAAKLFTFFIMVYPPIIFFLSADSLSVDRRWRMNELLAATSLSRTGYLAGKLTGLFIAATLPVAAITVLGPLAESLSKGSPGSPPAYLAAFLAIGLPNLAALIPLLVVTGTLLGRRLAAILFFPFWFWAFMMRLDGPFGGWPALSGVFTGEQLTLRMLGRLWPQFLTLGGLACLCLGVLWRLVDRERFWA